MDNTDNQGFEPGSEQDIVNRLMQMDDTPEPEAAPADRDPFEDNADEQDEAEDQPEEGDEGSDADDTETDDEPEDEPEYFTVRDGDKEKKVTKDELIKGYMKDADYRRKTEEVAREREATKAERQAVADLQQQRQQTVRELDALIELNNTLPYTQAQLDGFLSANDTASYLRAKGANEARQQAIATLRTRKDGLEGQISEADATALKETTAREQTKLAEVMPSLVKDKAIQDKFFRYTEGLGFTPDEVKATLDHRVIVAFEKARLYDDMQAKAKEKPGKPVPKVVKGNAQRQTSKEIHATQADAAANRFKKSGSEKDLYNLLLARS